MPTNTIMKLLFALFALWVAKRYHTLLDIGKELPPPSSCVLVNTTTSGEEIIPVEDFVLYHPGILFGGAGATYQCMHETPENSPPGFMIAVDVRSGKPVVSKLHVKGLPVRFQPHGLFYSTITNRLYVVNHGGASGVGTRVEMFDVHEDSSGLPALVWVMSIGGGHHFPSIHLNSVVEGKGDEVYITQFQNFPMPAAGEKHPVTLIEKFFRAVDFAISFVAVAGLTGVHHCTFDTDRQETTSCRMVLRGFVHANGLTINPDRSKLWVNDPARRSVHVYERRPAGNLVEVPDEYIYLPHVVDNIHYDEDSGHIYSGSLAVMHEQLDPSKPKQGTFLDISKSSRSSGKYDTFSDLVSHDGQLMSQISTCYKVSSEESAWGVCGSPGAPGVLVCDL